MKQFIPKQVIRQMIKYIDQGCWLETQIEDFEGGEIRRWYINTGTKIICIWSEPI